MFIFGARVHEVEQKRNEIRGGKKLGSRLKAVFDAILGGRFGDLNEMRGFMEGIMGGNDYYIVTVDFYEYLEAQAKVRESSEYFRWRRATRSRASGGPNRSAVLLRWASSLRTGPSRRTAMRSGRWRRSRCHTRRTRPWRECRASPTCVID